MKIVFQLSVILSLLAGFIGSALSYNTPIDVTFEMDKPPVWMLLMGLAAFVGVPLSLIAAGGLFSFKPWSRRFGLGVGAFLAIVVCAIAATAPFVRVLAPMTLYLYLFSAFLWFGSLVLGNSKAMSRHFES